jgi:hypothetical protein
MTLVKSLHNTYYIAKSRVVDPYQFELLDPDPDPGGQK